MKIVHIYDGHEKVFNGRGSVPKIVWNFARTSAARGHDVTVIERQWTGLAESECIDGVEFTRIDMLTGPTEPWSRIPYEEVMSVFGIARLVVDRSLFALIVNRRLRRVEPDIIHVHLPFAGSVLAAINPRLRNKMVYTAHLGELRLDMMEEGREGTVPNILNIVSPDVFLAKRVAKTTVLNSRIREAFIDNDVDPESLSVVPNGVNVEQYQNVETNDIQRVLETYRLDSNRPLVLFVGTLLPRKGVVDLVKAVGCLNDHDFQVLLAGETGVDEAYTREVKSMIKEKDLTDVIQIPGFVPDQDLPALYNLADVFVLPSHEEGFGMTVIEALAAGTPVIATNVGGIPEVIENGYGSIISVNDIDRMAAEIAEWLNCDDPELASQCRDRAKQYSWEEVGDKVMDIYSEIQLN